MTKGTTSFGRHSRTTHTTCRRCGRHAYHLQHKVCAACGFGKAKKIRGYSWKRKNVNRKRKL